MISTWYQKHVDVKLAKMICQIDINLRYAIWSVSDLMFKQIQTQVKKVLTLKRAAMKIGSAKKSPR